MQHDNQEEVMLIEVKDLVKIYGAANEYRTKALAGVSFAVQGGEFIGIMGASGSGKSTLLNILAAIDNPTAGQVKYENQDITLLDKKALARFRKDKLGFVFQEYNLLDILTIEENIILSLSLRSIPKSEIEQKVNGIAQTLGINEILQKFPYQVSGGQKQRCACARAMVTGPRLLLADEPTGALDSKAAHELLDTFVRINQKYHTTILAVFYLLPYLTAIMIGAGFTVWISAYFVYYTGIRTFVLGNFAAALFAVTGIYGIYFLFTWAYMKKQFLFKGEKERLPRWK